MLETVRVFLQPPLVYAIAAGWVALFVVLLVLARFTSRRHVTLRRSEGTEQLAFQLSRIADSLEILASMQARPRPRVNSHPRETVPPPAERRPRIRGYGDNIGLSMFGR